MVARVIANPIAVLATVALFALFVWLMWKRTPVAWQLTAMLTLSCALFALDYAFGNPSLAEIQAMFGGDGP
jgi:hypothetical protein